MSAEVIERVFKQAYEDGKLAAAKAGFSKAYELEKLVCDPAGYHLTYPTFDKVLTADDLGQHSRHILQLRSDGIVVFDARYHFVIEKGVLFQNERDLAGLVLATLATHAGEVSTHIVRLGLTRRTRHDQWKEGKVLSLAELVKDQVHGDRRAEILGLRGEEVRVTAPGTRLIRGMDWGFPKNSWLLEERGRAALFAALDDVFVLNERSHKLEACGIDEEEGFRRSRVAHFPDR